MCAAEVQQMMQQFLWGAGGAIVWWDLCSNVACSNQKGVIIHLLLICIPHTKFCQVARVSKRCVLSIHRICCHCRATLELAHVNRWWLQHDVSGQVRRHYVKVIVEHSANMRCRCFFFLFWIGPSTSMERVSKPPKPHRLSTPGRVGLPGDWDQSSLGAICLSLWVYSLEVEWLQLNLGSLHIGQGPLTKHQGCPWGMEKGEARR